jgi:nucleoside-diphosphate kinase
LAIIKPDVFASGNVGRVLTMIEEAGFRIVLIGGESPGAETTWEVFYEEHTHKPFYRGLVEFMCSGPALPLILEREDAVVELRRLIGATNPKNASDGTIRKRFGTPDGGPKNAIHASDSVESAGREINFFFGGLS